MYYVSPDSDSDPALFPPYYVTTGQPATPAARVCSVLYLLLSASPSPGPRRTI